MNWPLPTPPPEGKLPHRYMQRPLLAEVLAAADSLQELLLSGVIHCPEFPPFTLLFQASGSLEAMTCKDLNGVTIYQLGVKERRYSKFLRAQEDFLPLLMQADEV